MTSAERLWSEKKNMTVQLCDLTYEMGAMLAGESPETEALEGMLANRQELMQRIDILDRRVASLDSSEYTPVCAALKQEIHHLLVAILAEDRSNASRMKELTDDLSAAMRAASSRKRLGAYGDGFDSISIGFDVQK